MAAHKICMKVCFKNIFDGGTAFIGQLQIGSNVTDWVNDGSLAFALADRCQFEQLDGIDFSPAYIEYAKRRNHDPRIVFQA